MPTWVPEMEPSVNRVGEVPGHRCYIGGVHLFHIELRTMHQSGIMRRQRRRGEVSVIKVIIFLAVLAALVLAYIVGPYYVVWLKVDDICGVIARYWASGGSKRKSTAKLRSEIRTREIPEYINWKDDCELYVENRMNVVTCYWEVDVPYPFMDKYYTLSFEAYAEEAPETRF